MKGLRTVVLLATAEQHIALAANFVVAVLTSWLMSPQEIGVTVVGAAIVGLITALREYASPFYLMKGPELSRDNLVGVLTGMLVANAVLVLALVLIAPLFGMLYSDARLIPYLRIVALALLVEAFVLPAVAVMRREMAVDKAATIIITGHTVMAATTLGLAAAGVGYMSFAWGILCGHTAAALTATIIRPTFWLFRPSLHSWRALFAFGGYNGTNSLLRQLYDSIPYLVIGHILSFETVAYFHRALMLTQLPGKLLLGGVETMLLPHLSAELRQDRSLRATVLRVFECITAVYWPALIVLSILAQPVVQILYGKAWLPAVPLVQIMSLAALFAFIGKLDVSVLVATGGLPDLLKRSLIVFPACALIATLAAMLGVNALAFSYWATFPIQLVVSLYYIRRNIFFTWGELAAGLYKSAVIAIASAIGPLLVVALYPHHKLAIGGVCFAGLSAIAGWLFAIWLTQHPLFVEMSPRVRANPTS